MTVSSVSSAHEQSICMFYVVWVGMANTGLAPYRVPTQTMENTNIDYSQAIDTEHPLPIYACLLVMLVMGSWVAVLDLVMYGKSTGKICPIIF